MALSSILLSDRHIIHSLQYAFKSGVEILLHLPTPFPLPAHLAATAFNFIIIYSYGIFRTLFLPLPLITIVLGLLLLRVVVVLGIRDVRSCEHAFEQVLLPFEFFLPVENLRTNQGENLLCD